MEVKGKPSAYRLSENNMPVWLFFRSANIVNYFWDTILEVVSKPQIRSKGKAFPRIENGAYTLVREYFNLRDNAAIGP